MTSPLIWVPKKSTQDVDFAPHLKSVISRTYAESPEAYADELAQLNRSRQDALRGSAGSDVTGRDLLYKYFGQLELLELRFPELRVPFPWNDAFTNVKISQLSLAYEKASVIFNIGSTLSSLAASSPRSSPEGLKRAFHSFRCAAGMFTYINDNFLHAPSTDLSREVVKVLVGLMSAQAVEVFVESMPKESKLRPKLCMQAATLYGGIMEEVKEWVAKSVFIKEWSWLIQTKAKYFQSLANYYKSLQDTAAGSYGPALARLTLAQSLASEAHKLSQSFSSSFSTSSTSTSLSADAPSSLLTLTKTHLTLLTDALASANKDNDLVYNAVVPSVTSLPAIEGGKSVADPIAIHDVYATPEVQKVVGADLFAKLVPLSVHESASLYSEEKAKLVRGEQERCDVAEGENVAALEYMGLPSGLEKFRVGIEGLKDPGREIRSWCEEIVAGETEGGVDALLNKLVGLRESARSGLEESKRELDREERECESMRSRFGHLWEMEPSAGQTRSLRGDFQAHERSLGEARGSDERVMGIWEGVKRDVAIMADPSGRSVEALFASVVSGKEEKGLLDVDEEESGPGEEVTMMVDLIAESLAKLNKVKKERDEVLKDLKERVQADDISHLLILNRKGPASVEPTLFASELEKFRAHQTRITATIQHQQSTLAEISAQLKALNDSPRAKELQGTWSGADRKRKEVVERLRRAKQAYGEVRDGATKGVMFYEDLSSLVGGLKDQVRSFVRRRDDERDRMASTAAIKQRLEGGGGSSGLEGRMGGLDLGSGSRSVASPPPAPQQPQQPSWAAPSPPAPPQQHPEYSSPPPIAPQPQYAYSAPSPPAAPTASPYGNIPSSGAFSLSSPAPPPPQPPKPNVYSPQPATPYSAPSPYASPPPPQHQPSYQQPSYQAPQPQYGQPQQPQRQPSFPPPPQPTTTSSSFLPPPPPPVQQHSYTSYSTQPPQAPSTPSYAYGQQQAPYQQQPPSQPQYGAPQPPAGYQYGQPQQAQQPQQQQYGYAPQPPRPY